MKKYILIACLAFTLTSCKKDASETYINNSYTDTTNYKHHDNSLQKDFEENINDSRVKIIELDGKKISKEEALKIQIINISSTTHIIHKSDSITLKISLEHL